VLCVGAALAMNRARGAPFVGQFGLAIAIAGQTLLALGLFRAASPHDVAGCLAIAGMEVVMILAIADATHRTLAALFAVAALYASGWQSHAGTLLPAIAAMAFAATALGADRSARANALLQPASAGIAVAVLLYAPVATILDDVRLRGTTHALTAQWLQPSLLAVTFVVVVAILLRRAHADDQRIRVAGTTSAVALASALALAVATWPVPGLLAAMLVTIVSFAMGRRALTGLGLLAAVSMLGYYYFSLQTTLLVKALSLMGAGAVLLAAGGLLARRGSPAEGETHA
jgi:hypothetical protein